MQKLKSLVKKKKGGVVVSYATSTTTTTPLVSWSYPANLVKKKKHGV